MPGTTMQGSVRHGRSMVLAVRLGTHTSLMRTVGKAPVVGVFRCRWPPKKVYRIIHTSWKMVKY